MSEENEMDTTVDSESSFLEFTPDNGVRIGLPKGIAGDADVPEHVLLSTGLLVLLQHTNLNEIAGIIITEAENFDNPKDIVLPELKWTYTN